MTFARSLKLGWRSDMQLRHSALYLLAHGIPALAAFLTLALYTRWISPEDYGVYSTLIVVASSTNSVLFNWLYVAIIRYWHDSEIPELELNHLVFAVLLIGSLLILGLALIYFLLSHDAKVAITLAALMISNAIYTAYQRVNAISLKAERYLWVELVRVLMTTTLALALVWNGYSWLGILLATAFGFLVIPLLSPHFWQRFRHCSSQINYSHALTLLKYGLPLSLTFMLLELIHASDRVLLSYLVGFEAAGQYSVAFSLPYQLLILVASAINMAVYPLILKALEQEDLASVQSKLADYLLVLLGLLLPCYFGLLAISEDLLPLLIGAQYLAESLRLLPWIGLLLVINAVYLFHTSLAFQLAKQTQKTVWVVGVAAVLNILLNLLLIPLYAIDGAIAASFLAYVLCVVYGHYLGAKYFVLPVPWLEIIKLLSAAILMLAILKSLPLEAGLVAGLIRIVLGILIYAAAVWLLDVGKIRVYLANLFKQLSANHESTHYQA